MKIIKVEVPENTKALNMTILVANHQTGGFTMVTRGVDTQELDNKKAIRVEIEED